MKLSHGAWITRTRMLLIVGASLALLGVLSAGARAATAIDSYAPGERIGGNDWSDNNSYPAFGGLAVGSSTGNLFVPFHGNFLIQILSTGGTEVTTINPGASGINPLNVAVAPTTEAVFYSDSTVFSNGIGKSISDGAPTPTYSYDPTFAVAPGLITAPGAMAVDPATGDLLVVDMGANRVFRLNGGTGALVSSFDGSDTAAGAFQALRGIAVSATGTIYVTDGAADRVEQFSSAGVSQGSLVLPDGADPSTIAVNPATGDVAVLVTWRGETYLRGYGSNRALKFSERVSPALPPTGTSTFPSSGLAWDGTTNNLHAAFVDPDPPGVPAQGRVWSFVPAKQPGVDAPTATPRRNVAEVSAVVAPGGEDTTARLEYCAATANCDAYPVSKPGDANNPWVRGPEHPNITSDTTITDDLPLQSNQTWKVRVSADNTVQHTSDPKSHTENTSAVTTVNSPLLTPGVTTGPASGVSDSQATLSGTIDTMGAQTTYHFEYGLTSSYDQRVPASLESPAGNNRAPRVVTKAISGLQPGTTYHYRLVADNSVGRESGADRTFITAGADDIAPGRGYEQVTPIQKGGAQVLSSFHTQVSPDGNAPAIAVATVSGSSSDSETSMMRQNFVVRRGAGASGWSNWEAADAPQNAAPGVFEASVAAVSSDFQHALVASNRVLAPGGIAGGGNLYVKDLKTGAYTFVAGSSSSTAYGQLTGGNISETVFAAGAEDFSWVMFWTESPMASGVSGRALYRWSRAGGLTVESRVPPSDDIPTSPLAVLPNYTYELPIASLDGSLTAFDPGFFFGAGGLGGGVYVRRDGQSTPIAISKVAGGSPDNDVSSMLNWVTPDGRYVFFQAHAQLTDDAPASLGSNDAVYRYDTQTNDLTYISTKSGLFTFGFLGASDDGRTVYLYDNDGLVNQTTVWHDGVVRVVSPTDTVGSSRYATRNGRYFAWVDGDGKAYLYSLDDDETVCVSCAVDGSSGKAHMGPLGRSMGNTTPRLVAENGTAYFDTTTALIPSDRNSSKDVYAYKNGHLTLISPGDARYDAFFVGASADGKDVYFQTDQGLVSQDTDESSDVYDARAGGGLSSQNPPPPPADCVRAECSEMGSGPVTSAPAPSGMTSGSTGAKRTNQVKVKVKLGKVSFGAKSVQITFTANQRGRVKVSGSRVKTTYRNVTKAGTYSVTVPLSNKARAMRRAHKKFKVSLKVSLSGGWGSSSAKYSRTLGK